MKPFNLEEARAGKQVVTRNGRKARIICFDVQKTDYPIIALIKEENGTEHPITYTINGKYVASNQENTDDLFMADAATDNTFYAVVAYKDKTNVIGLRVYDDKGIAEEMKEIQEAALSEYKFKIVEFSL